MQAAPAAEGSLAKTELGVMRRRMRPTKSILPKFWIMCAIRDSEEWSCK